MNLKLRIIRPAHYRARNDRRAFKTRRRAVVPLTQPDPAALTPADWQVSLVDEQLDGIDFERYSGQICHIQPPHGTPGDIEGRIQDMHRRFYSGGSILSRLPLPVTPSNIGSRIIDLSERRMARSAQGGNDFGLF